MPREDDWEKTFADFCDKAFLPEEIEPETASAPTTLPDIAVKVRVTEVLADLNIIQTSPIEAKESSSRGTPESSKVLAAERWNEILGINDESTRHQVGEILDHAAKVGEPGEESKVITDQVLALNKESSQEEFGVLNFFENGIVTTINFSNLPGTMITFLLNEFKKVAKEAYDLLALADEACYESAKSIYETSFKKVEGIFLEEIMHSGINPSEIKVIEEHLRDMYKRMSQLMKMKVELRKQREILAVELRKQREILALEQRLAARRQRRIERGIDRNGRVVVITSEPSSKTIISGVIGESKNPSNAAA